MRESVVDCFTEWKVTHIIAVVQEEGPEKYRLAIATKNRVPSYRPFVQNSVHSPRDMREFLLSKRKRCLRLCLRSLLSASAQRRDERFCRFQVFEGAVA
jgi:hypothetical protein